MSQHRRSGLVADGASYPGEGIARDPTLLGLGLADFYGPVVSEQLPAAMRALLVRMDAAEATHGGGGAPRPEARDER